MAMTLMEIIKKYFDIYEAGSARDIYFRLGRNISYFSIQKVLDELERTNYIQHKSVRSTRYKRSHYVYYRTFKVEAPLPLPILIIKLVFKELVECCN